MTLSGRIDLPDEAARIKILEAQLSKMPWNPIDLQEFAHRMPGASAAKLRAVVDQTAGYALADNRKIEAEDLRRALHGHGGKDRPQLERVDWDNVVVSESLKQYLKSLVRLLVPARWVWKSQSDCYWSDRQEPGDLNRTPDRKPN